MLAHFLPFLFSSSSFIRENGGKGGEKGTEESFGTSLSFSHTCLCTVPGRDWSSVLRIWYNTGEH